MKKQSLSNLLTILIILAIGIGGFFAVRLLREEPAKEESSPVIMEQPYETLGTEAQALPTSEAPVPTEPQEPSSTTEPKETESVQISTTESSAPEATTEAAPEPTENTQPQTEAPPTEIVTTQEESTQGQSYCTITISCSTILDNMTDLEPGKAEFVPENGVILGTVTEPFSQGETVFDVLKRVCTSYGIPLEYSWTPMYDNYYIEGINHLYEFDCGSESGWMYKVNGWFPNYGCSDYVLQDGDQIAWCYTCKGYGADLGGGAW